MNVSEQSDARAPFAMLVAAAVASGAYLLVSMVAVSPIFGSDEYAYFISGRYFDRIKALYQLDPGLQQLSNVLYFKLIFLWSQVTGPGFVASFRLLHVVEHCLAGLLMYRIFATVHDRASALRGGIAFLLLPSSVYIFAVMPETELVLTAACLGYVLILVFPRRQYLSSAVAGLLVGAALLIKPHALALFGAAAFVIALAPLAGIVDGGRTVAIRATWIFLGAFYLAFVIIWRLCSGEWNADPRVALGLNFYGAFLGGGAPGAGLADKAIDITRYLGAHVVVICLIFSPVVVHVVDTLANMRKSSHPAQSGTAMACWFIFWVLVFHLLMTAYFSAGAEARGAAQAMRLHGRYLGPALAFLPYLYFASVDRLSERGLRSAGVLSLTAVLVCTFYVFGHFKLYPWDYPLLFAFFSAPNHYGWNYGTALPGFVGTALLWALAGSSVVLLLRQGMRRQVFALQLLAVLLAGGAQTYAWLYSHTQANADLVAAARSIGTWVAPAGFGKGVVVADARYGSGAFALFALGTAPRVLVRDAGSRLTGADIGAADWVLFAGDFQADFEYADALRLGALRLFPLKGLDIEFHRRDKKVLAPGDKADVLIFSRSLGTRLQGFNAIEDWGAWTRTSKASIELPFRAQGSIQMVLSGWALDENNKEPLKVTIGSRSALINLTTANKGHSVRFSLDQPADRVELEFPVVRPPTSNRDMGVAISYLKIERVD